MTKEERGSVAERERERERGRYIYTDTGSQSYEDRMETDGKRSARRGSREKRTRRSRVSLRLRAQEDEATRNALQ